MQSRKFNAAEEAVSFMSEEIIEANPMALRFGKKAISLAFWIGAVRPLLTLVIMFGLSALPVFAQNPFGTPGDQTLGNLVANVLTIAAWLALAVGILSFMTIPIAMKMKWDWMNNLYAGIFGVGGWGIAGSLGYMLANNQDVNLEQLN